MILYGKISHYLKKCNAKKDGGLEVVGLDMLNSSYKRKFVIDLLAEKDSIWNMFPKYVFNLMGGLEFLPKCD